MFTLFLGDGVLVARNQALQEAPNFFGTLAVLSHRIYLRTNITKLWWTTRPEHQTIAICSQGIQVEDPEGTLVSNTPICAYGHQ